MISRFHTLTLAVGTVFACGAMAGSAPTDDSLFEAPARLKAGDGYIDTDVGHAAPYLYDFNRNGKDDLLVGQFGEGKLRIYLNRGSNAEPVYGADFQWFKADHEFGTVPSG
ncbi:MAG: hypothetical protein HND57_00400 [Planctomycetes bacterium]|nr:hypothetical protein [Planctomycetota bacterium]